MKILLADDDQVFQLILGKTLARWGYEVVIAKDGEQAWEQLNSPTGPQLAIVDWVMPQADGIEVCRRVRRGNLTHYVYIILLTGKSEADDILTGLEAGADDYLPKPVNLTELKLRLRSGIRVLHSEERHRIIAETASDGIVTMENDDRIRYANSAASAIFGCSPADLIGQPLSRFVPEFDHHLENPGSASAAGEDTERVRSWSPIEIPATNAEGRSMLLDVSFSAYYDSHQMRILTAMIRDVTERRLIEGQKAQNQKLESIGQLAAGVAHEINTPIQYIGDNLRFIQEAYGALERLLDVYRQGLPDCQAVGTVAALIEKADAVAAEVDLDYLRRESPAAIEQALEGVERVALIVRAMKEFSHPASDDMAPTDLNRLIETTALVSRNSWKYVADLTTDLDPNLPAVNCVAGELAQVVLNLIVNAADAIADALHDQPGQKGAITVTSSCEAGWAEIRVRDSGTGIPLSVRARIFDPFFTTKEVGKGTGQGLAIAHAIIAQKHHGVIDYETSMGKGTTFIVRLPIVQPEPESTPAEEQYVS